MGAASSTNIAKTVANATSNVLNKVMMSQTSNINSSQIISVSDVTGDVNIDNNQFTANISVNMKQLLNSLTNSNIKDEVASEVAQAAKSLVKDINLGNISTTTNDIENVINESINLTTSLDSTCSSSIGATQSITVNKVNGDVEITNNTFNNIAKMVGDCMVKTMSQNSAIQTLQTKIDQTASSSTSGFSIWGLAGVIGAIVLGLIVVTVGPTVVPLIAAGKNPQIFGFLVLFIATIFIIIWYAWTSKASNNTIWSKPLDATCVPTTILKQTNSLKTADQARTTCLSTDGCVAFDFVLECDGNQPHETLYTEDKTHDPVYKTTLYSSIFKDCKPGVDDSKILTKRSVIVSANNAVEKESSEEGAVWINRTNATFQILKKADSKLYWTDPEKFGKDINYITNVNIDGATILDDSNVMYQTGWEMSAEKDLLKYTFTNDGQSKTVAGPGYIISSDVLPNVSGIVVTKRKSWILFTGIGFVILGVILLLFLKPKNKVNYEENDGKNVKKFKIKNVK